LRRASYEYSEYIARNSCSLLFILLRSIYFSVFYRRRNGFVSAHILQSDINMRRGSIQYNSIMRTDKELEAIQQLVCCMASFSLGCVTDAGARLAANQSNADYL